MQLHYNWMVLVAIAWTILLDASVQESVTNIPRIQGNEKKHWDERYDADSHQPASQDSSSDVGSRIPENTTISRSNMGRDIIENDRDIKANNQNSRGYPQANESTSTVIPENDIDTNNDYSKTADKHHYGNDGADHFNAIHQSELNPISSTENFAATPEAKKRTNSLKQSASNFSKSDTIDATFDNEAVARNESLRQEFQLTNVVSDLSRDSTDTAPLNSNVSRMNYRTSDRSLESQADDFHRSSSQIKSTRERSNGDTQWMGFQKSTRSNENSEFNKRSSSDTRRKTSSLIDMGIKNEKGNTKESFQMETMPDTKIRHVDDPPDSEYSDFSVNFDYIPKNEAAGLIRFSDTPRETPEFVTMGKTKNINLIPISNYIPQALFVEDSIRNSEQLETRTYTREGHISTKSVDGNVDERQLKNPSSLRPEIKMVSERQRKVQDINYLESKKAKRSRSSSTTSSSSGSSVMNNEKFLAARRKAAVKNNIFRRIRSDRWKNNEQVETPDLNDRTKRVSSVEEFVDNTANPDRATGNRDHRSVVKIAGVGFQTDQRSHKSLIAQESTAGINVHQDQKRKDVQERKEQVQELFSGMGIPQIERSHLLEDGASGSITLENSSAFSSLTVMQRKAILLKSSVTPERTRKMEFSESELDDTRASRNKKTGSDRVISSKGPNEFSPTSVPIGTKDQRRSVVAKDLANAKTTIDWHIATDTTTPVGSSFVELRPGECGPDDSGKGKYDCNGDGVTTEVVRLRVSRNPRVKALQLHEIYSGREELSGSQSSTRSKLVTSLVSSVGIESAGNDNKVAAVFTDKMNKKNSKDNTPGSQPMTSSTFFSILLNDQPDTDHITNVIRPSAPVDENDQADKHVPMKHGIFGQENYKRKVDTTYSATTVNSLKVRDSNAVKNDSSKVQVVTRNNTDGKTVDLDRCETCEILDSAKNTSIERERKGFVGSDQRNREHVQNGGKRIESSVTKLREIESADHAEITTTTHIGVGPVLIAGDGSSLAQASAESKVIDHLRPEARVGVQLQTKNTEMLVRGQEPISIASVRENLILTREVEVDSRPSRSDEVNATDNYVSSELIIEERNENSDNGSHVHPDVGSQERHSYYTGKKKAYAEHAQVSFIPRVVESFTDGRNSSLEFSNNALTIPRRPGNFSIYATAQTRSLTASGRRRKSLGHDAVTAGSTSSTKTDSSSIWPIGRTWDDDRYSMRKEHLDVSQSGISNVSLASGELQNDTAAEQIKRGFTSKDTTIIAVTEPSTIRYHEYTNSDTVLSSRAHDIKPNENITRTIEDDTNKFEASNTNLHITKTEESSNTANLLHHKVIPNPVANLSTVSVTIPNPDSDHHDLAKSIDEEKSSSLNERVSPILRKPHSEQHHENVRIDLQFGDSLSLNHTDRDNSTRITATLNQWPVKHSAVVEGDLLLGGLMMVHEREDSITCGPVMPQGGVQALEAMLYTLDWLNKRDLVPGVKIGAHILDDCDKDTYGLEMAVDFIKGSISNIDGAEYHCNKTAVRKVISGVVGAASSVTSIQVANLLRLFRIPQVSFFSTSPELSNKMRFEYFTRTIPSDHYQVKAMVDIVLVMGWSYVSIIYEESNYGEKAYEELEKLLGKHQICIAVKEKLSKDSGVAEAHVYDNIVLKLLTKPRARGCIIFASDQEVAGVMKAVRRCNATGAFSWIGSDGWSARSLVSDGNEPEMEGTLSVQPQANPVEGFEDYFLNLTVENNRRNPWFVEFWEDHFKCRYPNASQTPYNNYTEECTTIEKLTKQNTAFEDQLQFVSDAVLAFAYAFREMHKNLCHGNRGLCDAMKPTKGTELLNYLRNVEFKGLSGDVFHFDKNGDGPARYNIIHFKQVSPGKYKWIKVGKYLEGELRLNMSEIQFRLGHPEPPESVCSLPCEVGQAKKYVEGESCCWHCFNCTQYQIRHINDEKQCVLCPQGTVPDETHSYCRDIPEEFLRPESGWAIGAMSFSSTGILITLFVGGVFLKHNDTPIVRASGRELSYVLLVGILMCYLVTFALVLRPNDFVCSIQRFSAGFCFTVVYAALLTKTNRISRIFNAGKHSAKRPSFISPRSQLIICSMLVGVQILINGVWMVIDPAKAMHHYPTREDNLLVCNSYIDASYMIAFTYPIILIVVCTVYAVLTRKIPEAFNESKHIGFTMYTTCVIWLAFVPLYFATGSHVALRITSMSVTISLSASVTIACLFSPKLYIILIHPERNVRPNMMMQNRYNTTKGSVVTATNASMAPVTLTAVTCDQGKAIKKHFITTIDSSTQIEQYEMELKDQKNGKITPAVVNRETQTLLNNNGKESSVVTSPVIMDIKTEEIITSKGLSIGKIANGPMNQNEVPL